MNSHMVSLLHYGINWNGMTHHIHYDGVPRHKTNPKINLVLPSNQYQNNDG